MGQIKLFFWHQGALNKNKDIFFTPVIISDKNKIITQDNMNNLIEDADKIQTIKSSVVANFLLNVGRTLYITEYVNEKESNLITIENNNKTLLEELKNISNKNIVKLVGVFKIAEEFIKNNEQIINEIPIEYKIIFIYNCLNNHYDDKLNLFK